MLHLVLIVLIGASAAASDHAPYPASPVIKSLTIQPDRQSVGNGDNWPITWADDDAQYTVYCDGKGFGGGSGEGSMSLAKITGSPPDIQGENITSPSGHKTGGGEGGRKASGLLMVDGVLYMWVRNLNKDGTGSSLAWSKDHARTWTWADWSFPGIGYPAWLNAGKNYDAAQDGYAYLYSPDTPSAYRTSDNILLARVLKGQITNKGAYCFFAGLDDRGQPKWLPEFKDRKPAFTDPSHCYRPDVVYNPSIKRYLLCTATSGSRQWCGTDIKYLGIFDSPTPWGPWTTVTQIEGWGGEENRFQPRIPSKWISEDGKTFFLLYSCFPQGPYQFNVQKCVMHFAGDDKATNRVELARMLVAQMAAGQFDKAVEPFDSTMQRALPAAKLKEVWDSLLKQQDQFQRATETTTEKFQKYEVVYVTCEFQRGKLDTKVVFDGNKITGLFFVPGRYRPPPYVDSATFEEKEISIGKGLWRLPGTLSLPKDTGPFPAVILVHGSGPHDRDETIGPNKPFRDLAHGLASRGIAVLRYEKRTKHHQIMMVLSVNSITVKEETIDDVVAAVEALASQEKIDPKRIFVLGHSLGGMLLPRIGKGSQKIAGFISLAGSTRPLEDLVLEQSRYLLSLKGTPPEEAQKRLKEIEQQVAMVKSARLSEGTSKSELPLGVPAKYWLDLQGYRPAEEAKALSKAMLILQGERDYQVTMEDFAGWKKALGSRKDVAFISYPKLNHLFMDGEGKSTPAEYSVPGNVAKVVIDDIAKWIKGPR